MEKLRRATGTTNLRRHVAIALSIASGNGPNATELPPHNIIPSVPYQAPVATPRTAPSRDRMIRDSDAEPARGGGALAMHTVFNVNAGLPT